MCYVWWIKFCNAYRGDGQTLIIAKEDLICIRESTTFRQKICIISNMRSGARVWIPGLRMQRSNIGWFKSCTSKMSLRLIRRSRSKASRRTSKSLIKPLVLISIWHSLRSKPLIMRSMRHKLRKAWICPLILNRYKTWSWVVPMRWH